MIVLASLTGVMAGCGAVLFTLLIDVISGITVRPIYQLTLQHGGWLAVLCMVPISGFWLLGSPGDLRPRRRGTVFRK